MFDLFQGLGREPVGDGTANRETTKAMDATFALLKVDGVSAQVPVDERVTPSVKIESLSTDGGRREREAKWGIECLAKLVCTDGFLAVLIEAGDARLHKRESSVATNRERFAVLLAEWMEEEQSAFDAQAVAQLLGEAFVGQLVVAR